MSAKIASLRPRAASDNRADLFKIVCDMEDDLSAAEKLAEAIAIMTESLDGGPLALSVQHIVHEIARHIRALEDQRGKLFHATHFNRPVGGVS
jgi:hypothetical protein